MKYMILENSNPKYLVDNVNRWIAEGWKPLGGVATSITEYNNTRYCQAIIKEEK